MMSPAATTERFLRLPQVRDRVGLSRTEIYRQIQAGTFPKQHRRSHKVAVWYGSDIDEWVDAQMKADALVPGRA